MSWKPRLFEFIKYRLVMLVLTSTMQLTVLAVATEPFVSNLAMSALSGTTFGVQLTPVDHFRSPTELVQIRVAACVAVTASRQTSAASRPKDRRAWFGRCKAADGTAGCVRVVT